MVKKITSIAAQKKPGRFNIFLDGQYAFPVSVNVLIKYRLTKGMELTEDLITALKQADLQAKAYNKALDYLSYQLRTEKEISTYLKKLATPADDIADIIAKLHELNLLDDLAYAKSYVRTSANTTDKGPFVITQKLKQKGVSQALITEALTEFSLEQQVQNAVKIAQKFVAKNSSISFQALKTKLQQRLATKGFSSEVISLVMDELQLTKDEDQQAEALKKQAQKIWRRYQRFDEPERSFKLKQALYRKGFSLTEIESYLQKLAE